MGWVGVPRRVLSTSLRSSRDNLARSPLEKARSPVQVFSNTSGPIASLSCGGEMSLFGPVLIQDLSYITAAIWLNFSNSSPIPP